MLGGPLPRLLANPDPAAPLATYRLHPDAREAARYVLNPKIRARHDGAQIYNDPKIRLVSDPAVLDTKWADDTWYVERTFYFDSEVTNQCVGRRLRVRTADHVGDLLWDAREHMTRDGRLVALQDSSLSNHIGISTLALLPDGRVPYIRQSPKNNIDGGLIAPSGSGSTDAWRDVGGTTALVHEEVFADQMIRRAMERELLEESFGIETGRVSEPNAMTGAEVDAERERFGLGTRILGYGRYLHRGGKPEFFGLTFVGAARPLSIEGEEQLLHSTIETVQTNLRGPRTTLDELEAFRNALMATFDGLRPELGCSMWANLLMLEAFLASVARRYENRPQAQIDLLAPDLLG
jgi:hypothetical protein